MASRNHKPQPDKPLPLRPDSVAELVEQQRRPTASRRVPGDGLYLRFPLGIGHVPTHAIVLLLALVPLSPVQVLVDGLTWRALFPHNSPRQRHLPVYLCPVPTEASPSG